MTRAGASPAPTGWLVALAGLVALKLWLVAAQPIHALPWANVDDGLFVKLADNILRGAWLGDYDVHTLAKGAGYPLFMAGVARLGLPLFTVQHALYALSAAALVVALFPVLPGRGWRFGLFAVLLWNPMTFEADVMGRVLRQHLYTPLTLFALAGLIALHTRAAAAPFVRAAWAILLGLSLSGMTLTREETIWIAPTTILLVLVAALHQPRQARAWLRWGWPLAAASLTALVPQLIIADLNARHYGWRGLVEYHSAEYVGAYGALTRVIPAVPPLPKVPVRRAARELVYPHSPAFASLRPSLEGDIGLAAALSSQPFTQLDPEQREIAGGWWMWAIRDAAQLAGHTPDARTALAFYAQLAREIDAACDTGHIPAGLARHTLLPLWHDHDTIAARQSALPFLWTFVSFHGFTAITPESMGDDYGLKAIRRYTQRRHSTVPGHPKLDAEPATVSEQRRIAVLDRLGRGLAFVAPGLIIVGVLAWIVALIRAAWKQGWPDYAWWAATAMWGAVAAVLTITFIIHLTSFPSANPGYFSHAYPCALASAVLSVAASLRPRAASAAAPPPAPSPARGRSR